MLWSALLLSTSAIAQEEVAPPRLGLGLHAGRAGSLFSDSDNIGTWRVGPRAWLWFQRGETMDFALVLAPAYGRGSQRQTMGRGPLAEQYEVPLGLRVAWPHLGLVRPWVELSAGPALRRLRFDMGGQFSRTRPWGLAFVAQSSVGLDLRPTKTRGLVLSAELTVPRLRGELDALSRGGDIAYQWLFLEAALHVGAGYEF